MNAIDPNVLTELDKLPPEVWLGPYHRVGDPIEVAVISMDKGEIRVPGAIEYKRIGGVGVSGAHILESIWLESMAGKPAPDWVMIRLFPRNMEQYLLCQTGEYILGSDGMVWPRYRCVETGRFIYLPCVNLRHPRIHYGDPEARTCINLGPREIPGIVYNLEQG